MGLLGCLGCDEALGSVFEKEGPSESREALSIESTDKTLYLLPLGDWGMLQGAADVIGVLSATSTSIENGLVSAEVVGAMGQGGEATGGAGEGGDGVGKEGGPKVQVESLEGGGEGPWAWKALFAAQFWSTSLAAWYQASGSLSLGQFAVMVATAV